MGSSKILSSKSSGNMKTLNKSFCEESKKAKSKSPQSQGLKVNLKLNSLKEKPNSKIINCANTPENRPSTSFSLKTKTRNLSGGALLPKYDDTQTNKLRKLFSSLLNI